MNIAKKIKKIRTIKRYTQKKFAELLEVKPNTIRDIELERQNVTVNLLSKIIEKFQIDPRYFFSVDSFDLTINESEENKNIKIPYIDIFNFTNINKTLCESYTDYLILSKKIVNILNIDNYNNLYAAICPTNALAPEIKKNEIIIIDSNYKKFVDGNLYLIEYFSEIIIRKVIITNKYIFKALDNLHIDIVLNKDSLNDVNIVGEIKHVIKNI